MFSSRNIIGTPQRNGNVNTNSNKIDFTPIGRSKRNVQLQENNQNKPQVHRFDDTINSSFDHTGDDFYMDTTINSFKQLQQQKPVQAKFNPNVAKVGPSRYGNSHILNNGGFTSIKEQQLENQKLETENYNLKIKLATLTKFLDQTPEEQRDLLNQNIDLKQQLMHCATEIRTLKETVRDLQYLTNKENVDDDVLQHQFESKEDFEHEKERLREEYKMMVEKYEKELDQVKDQSQKKMQPLSHEVNKLLIELEESKDDYRRLQGNNSELRERLDTIERKHEDLQREYEALNLKIQHTNSQSNHEVEELYNELAGKKQQLNESENAVSNLKRELSTANDELVSLQGEITHWRSKYQLAENDSNNESRQILEDLNLAKEEIRSLKTKLRDLEFEYNSIKRSENVESGEVSRLTSKIENLLNELKDKDKEEYNLRSQINALIKKAQSNLKEDSSLKFYQDQCESFKNKEVKLKEELRKLEIEIIELRQQLSHSSGVNDNLKKLQVENRELRHQLDHSASVNDHIKRLQGENREINDKLDYYEEEYARLERAFKKAEEDLQAEQRKYEQRIKQFEFENKQLIDKIKNTHVNNSASHSALDELEALTRRKLEGEKQQLIGENDSLKYELSMLKRELDMERTLREQQHIQHQKQQQYTDSRDPRSYPSFPAMPMTPTTPTSNYHHLMEDKDDAIRDLQKKTRRLEQLINEKDSTIDTLEIKIREMDRANKLSYLVDDEQRTDLFKLKSNQASKIKILELENESLQSEIEYFKKKLDEAKISSTSESIVALLEKQLKDSKSKQEELSNKLKISNEVDWKLEKVQKENGQLVELISNLEASESMYKSENSHLEIRTKTLTQELNKAKANCSKLADKIREMRQQEDLQNHQEANYKFKKVQELQFKNSELERKLRTLETKFQSTTPTSVTKENELKYYKAKLYDVNLLANDLKVMKEFIMSSIKNSNQYLKDDIIKLTKCGVYPDYSAMKNHGKKLTFKVLAKFVLAGVRIKNRYERAEKRKLQLFELKSDIERGSMYK